MKKLLKGVKKWFIYNGRDLGIVLLILSTIGYGVYYAVTNKEEIVVEDFGDATLSVKAQEISHLSYEDAIQLIANGETDRGLAVMHRLAPLSHATTAITGNGNAHLWMALDQLHVEEFGFLSEFPIEVEGGTILPAPVHFAETELTRRGQQHLVAAVKLSPELKQPALMLAELMIAKGRRNDAIAMLIKSGAGNDGKLLSLGVNVANACSYEGDDLTLKDTSWHQVAVLGKKVQAEDRGNINVRLEYLLNAMVVAEFDLASVGIQKFERDFDDRANSVTMIAELKATLAYFKALFALKGNDVKSAAAHLMEAQKLQAGRDAFVSALSVLVKKHPGLRSALQGGVGPADADQQVKDKVAAAKLALLQAEVFPENASGYVKKSVSLAPSEPTVARAHIALELKGDAPNLSELSAMAAEALKTPGLKSEGRYKLFLTQGELLVAEARWKEAVIALEQALVLKSGDVEGAKLHKLLGAAYKALGQELIADEHLALAE